MKQTRNSFKIIYTLFALFFSSGVILFQSCGIDDFSSQPQGNYISGWAIFVDTSWYHEGGYYAAALYNKVDHPYAYSPVTLVNLNISGPKPNPTYWRLDREGTGNFYAAIVWVRNNSTDLPTVLGTYGCDTSRSCNDGTVIAFPNYTGANYNIKCFCDTAKGLN